MALEGEGGGRGGGHKRFRTGNFILVGTHFLTAVKVISLLFMFYPVKSILCELNLKSINSFTPISTPKSINFSPAVYSSLGIGTI